jgi:hypothetical protein
MVEWGGHHGGWGGFGPPSYIVKKCPACNCDKNDHTWRQDSGYLTDKSTLPVTELRFGDTGGTREQGYHTLGKLRCWG